MRTRRGLPQWPDLTAADHLCTIQASSTGAFCPSLLSLFGGSSVWNHYPTNAAVAAALPTFSRSLPLMEKPSGILCVPHFGELSSSVTELL